MAVMNKPDEQIFASGAKNGEVVTFPNLARGWGITFDETNGVPPMEYFNALFKRLDEKDLYLLQRGVGEWSATMDYPVNALVQHNGSFYRSLQANKNKTPNGTTAYWTKWGVDSDELKKITPKTITATSKNQIASDGHTHEIAKASTTQAGVTKLNSATNSNSETEAATPKAVKTVNDKIDNLIKGQSGFIPNSAKSDELYLESSYNVATSKAVSQLNKTKAPLNNPEFTGTVKSSYRVVIDLNQAEFTPYLQLKDSSVDVSKTVSKVKAVGDIHTLVKNGVSERIISTLRTNIQTDKNATGHYGVADSAGNMRWAWSAFGKTGNVAIGKTTDDGENKLQVAGSIHATGQTILNNPAALVRFQNNGTNYGYIGFPGSNSKNIRFSSNLWGNSYIELQENKIVAGQALYEGSNRVQHQGMNYVTVTATTQQYAGLNVVRDGKWVRMEALPDKSWKWIYEGDNAYYLPRNNSGKDKTIATTDDVQDAENRAKTAADNAQRTATAAAGTATWSGVSGKPGFNSNVNSTAENQFATPKAVKAAYDRASTAITDAANAKTAADNAQRTANGKANASHTHTYNQISNFAAGVVAQFGQSNAQTGWTKLPNGLIIQWGRSTGTSPVKFPLKFPNACYTVVHSHNATHVHDFGNSIIIGDTTTTEFKFYSWGNTAYVNWIAIGR